MAVMPGAANAGNDALVAAPGGQTQLGDRATAFRIDPRRSVLYRVLHAILVAILVVWFRPRVRGRSAVPATGPAILAPVHRSFIDFAFTALLTRRKLFFMAKEELWRRAWFGRLLEALGVFPVHRSGTDRESVRRAEDVLNGGHLLVMFPEGARRSGDRVGELAEGVAFLAARTGAPIVPIGISGSERAMKKGSRFPKPVRVTVSAGEPLISPERTPGRRVARSQIHRLSESLQIRLQDCYDDAAAR